MKTLDLDELKALCDAECDCLPSETMCSVCDRLVTVARMALPELIDGVMMEQESTQNALAINRRLEAENARIRGLLDRARDMLTDVMGRLPGQKSTIKDHLAALLQEMP